MIKTMNEILKYTHVFYFVFTWLFAFVFIKPKRIDVFGVPLFHLL